MKLWLNSTGRGIAPQVQCSHSRTGRADWNPAREDQQSREAKISSSIWSRSVDHRFGKGIISCCHYNYSIY